MNVHEVSLVGGLPPSHTEYDIPMLVRLAARSSAAPRSQHSLKPQAKPRRCRFPDCHKTAKPGGLCISHGGGRKCAVENCTTSMVSRGFCVAHGGGKRCQSEGCPKSAQGGGYCWIHGGGKKCGVSGCTKRAQSGGVCISHGGGKRCRMGGCNKVGQYDGLCVAHGGYRKCLYSAECETKALANGYCIDHGGRTKCLALKCQKKAVCGDYCSEHHAAMVLSHTGQQQLVEPTRGGARSRNTDAVLPARMRPRSQLPTSLRMTGSRSHAVPTQRSRWKSQALERLRGSGVRDTQWLKLAATEARSQRAEFSVSSTATEYRLRHPASWPYGAALASQSRANTREQEQHRSCAVVVCPRLAKVDGLCLIHSRSRHGEPAVSREAPARDRTSTRVSS